jgi:hypothetical protein
MDMNILLVYSTRNMGYDPVIPAICDCLRGHSVTVGDMDDRGFKIERDPEEYELVLTMDASSWYFNNRLAIRGSFMACLSSFCMGDLYRILQQEDLPGLGIGAIFSNCYAFQQQIKPGIPVFYTWKPVTPVMPDANAPKSFPFGTIIPNIADRDFSLVALVAKWVKVNGKGIPFPIFVPESERARLPSSLEEFRVPVGPSQLFECWTYLKNYIPATRITDYRGGIIPVELVQAALSGVPPVIIAHPIVMPLSGTIEPLYSAMSQLRHMLPTGLEGRPMAEIRLKPDLLPTPERFVEQVIMAYRTWRNDATPGRTPVYAEAGSDSDGSLGGRRDTVAGALDDKSGDVPTERPEGVAEAGRVGNEDTGQA